MILHMATCDTEVEKERIIRVLGRILSETTLCLSALPTRANSLPLSESEFRKHEQKCQGRYFHFLPGPVTSQSLVQSPRRLAGIWICLSSLVTPSSPAKENHQIIFGCEADCHEEEFGLQVIQSSSFSKREQDEAFP